MNQTGSNLPVSQSVRVKTPLLLKMVAGCKPFLFCFKRAPIWHPPLSQLNRASHKTNRPPSHYIPALPGHRPAPSLPHCEGLITPVSSNTIRSASSVVIVWKGVDQHLFLKIIPSNFTARTGRKVWCDRGMSRWLRWPPSRPGPAGASQAHPLPPPLPIVSRWLRARPPRVDGCQYNRIEAGEGGTEGGRVSLSGDWGSRSGCVPPRRCREGPSDPLSFQIQKNY